MEKKKRGKKKLEVGKIFKEGGKKERGEKWYKQKVKKKRGKKNMRSAEAFQ